jgi:hypothetical protein
MRTLRSAPFQWKRLVAKEYGTTFSGASAVLGLLLLERLRIDEYVDDTLPVTIIVSVWVVLLIGYLTARLLKKRGRLDETT